MIKIAEAFKGIFTEAALSGGNLARTAAFVLDNVDWEGKLNIPEPMSHPTVDRHLEAACAKSGPNGSPSQIAAEALWQLRDQVKWRESSNERDHEPDIAGFAPNFTATYVIGKKGLLASDKIKAGYSFQGPDIYYPTHAHHAEESYWIIGGDGDWKIDSKPWFPVKAGTSIYHQSAARHAMQTNEQALLTIWLWTSHLDSEVVIVRGGSL